jgi:energy-coupling factor transporter ATP-binding protein EcfA2
MTETICRQTDKPSFRKDDVMKKFHLTDTYTLINFDTAPCDSEVAILGSRPFEMVLYRFIQNMRKSSDPLMEPFAGIRKKMFLDAYKMLMVYPYEDVMRRDQGLAVLLNHREAFYRFTEALYDDWRKLERFGIMPGYRQSASSQRIVDMTDAFNTRVLNLYRSITQNIKGHPFLVLRQLPSGVNATISTVRHRFSYHKDYVGLQNVNAVTHVLSRPPFIVYSKANTRKGLFQEIDHNPLPTLSLNRLHYINFPVMVGPLLAFIFIHRDFLHHGVALANLFEHVPYESLAESKPDLVYVYGIREDAYDGTYFVDTENDINIGFVSRSLKNDYFGYLKKMMLTLHNVHMIRHGNLPIHGAMVSVTLKDKRTKNIVIIGDSGAGKSETLEALRRISGTTVRSMRVIFDDMGTFILKDGKIVAKGTEIGAFVRLDDLDQGYAYREIDRAIFMNPDKTNARVVLPVTEYGFMVKDHKVDMVLYANNYDVSDDPLSFFQTSEDALEVFSRGRRFAKGTTAEEGLVESYFANPFGPVQHRTQTQPILESFFRTLSKTGVPLGELRTGLAVAERRMSGPDDAAKRLLEALQTDA